jgi:NitT/TauT family transport system substrate-binding protein
LAERASITWISPRGTLEVMDDYPLWVAIEMGYFDELGLDVTLEPGTQGGPVSMALITEGQADVGFPSPGVVSAAIDTGIPVTIAFGMAPTQVFNFAVREDSTIESVADLAGTTIALWDVSGSVIVDPILAEAGVDPASVTYVGGGGQWGQLVEQGQADAALNWEGLRAQWDAIGLNLRYLIGTEFSNDPSNGYAIRAADLEDPAASAVMTCFLRGVVMGLEFGRVNPQAAAQITYGQFPALQEQMEPTLALESMRQLMYLYNTTNAQGLGYGYNSLENWQSYLNRLAELGQTTRTIEASEAVNNSLIEAVNAIDKDRIAADAAAYELNEDWASVELQGPVEPEMAQSS